jgi:hypothetical protein
MRGTVISKKTGSTGRNLRYLWLTPIRLRLRVRNEIAEVNVHIQRTLSRKRQKQQGANNMTRMTIVLTILLLAAGVGAQEAPKATTPDALKAEIDALRPANHVWRAIDWKTCPLEALKAAREQKKPIIAWVFLGVPTDERC